MAHTRKRARLSDIENFFTHRGDTADEIVMQFDDDKKLYVSKNFLIYASPVFRAMFEHEYKESITKTVHMKKKSSDDVKEFLLCLHPGVRKPVDDENMLRVFPLADEYQVEPLIKECKQRMIQVLLLQVQSAYTLQSPGRGRYGTTCYTMTYKEAGKCLEILKTADAQNCDDIIKFGIAAITNFGFKVFSGSTCQQDELSVVKVQSPKTVLFQFSNYATGGSENQLANKETHVLQTIPPVMNAAHIRLGTMAEEPSTKVLRQRCKMLYDSLSDNLKCRILSQRLQTCDDNRFRLLDEPISDSDEGYL